MKKFGKLLSETVDDTLRQVLGENASKLIYALLEGHISLRREEVGEKIEAFCVFLEKLLGSEGAQILQATSLKRLYLNLRREYEKIETYFLLLDELYEIKFKLLGSPLEQERLIYN